MQATGFFSALRINRTTVGMLAGVLICLSLTAQAADIPSISLTAKQGRFEPVTVKVPAGQKFKLVVKNEGPGAEEFESAELNREQVVPPGSSTVIFLGPLERGTYSFFGDFHPDTAKGQIVVE
jgi:plastocyanin